MGIAHTFRATMGRTGATFGHPLAAVSYAKYLSAEFHAWANTVILERLAERRTKASRHERKGRDANWIRQRTEGAHIRNELTDALKLHGITEGAHYAICTDAVYRSLFGKSKKEICLDRELPPTANLRDHLESPQLAAVALSEAVAERGISTENLQGLIACKGACSMSASAVAKAIAHAREEIAALSGKRKS